MWYVETARPTAPSRVTLVRAGVNSLEICWTAILTADAYILQLMKADLNDNADRLFMQHKIHF
jgi:host cell factor